MPVSVRLSADLEHRLNHLAEKTHRSKSFYVLRAVKNYLEDREDYLLAAAAFEEYVQSGKKGIALEEVEKKLGLSKHL